MNSFGYGGANAHVVLENAEDYLRNHNWEFGPHTRKSATGAVLYNSKLTGAIAAPKTRSITTAIINTPSKESSGISTPSNPGPHGRLFVFSSFDEATGKKYLQSFEKYVEDRSQITDSEEFLDDLAYTLGERRTNHTWRTAVPAQSVEELLINLREGINFGNVSQTKNLKIGFVFTGQGAQWCGMGKELIDQYPVFKETIEKAGIACQKAGATFNLESKMLPCKFRFELY